MSSPGLPPFQERLWRSLLDALPHPAWVAEPGRGITLVNARLEALTGRSGKALLGNGLTAAVHKQDREWLAAPPAGSPGTVTVRLTDGEGTWHTLGVNLQPLSVEAGGQAWLGQALPLPAVPNLAQAEAALFRQLAEANPIGVVVGRPDGSLPYANDAYLRLIGASRADFGAGRVNWQALTPPEWRSADERAVAQALERGHSGPYEKEYLLAGGVRRPVLIGLARLQPGSDEVVAYVLDMTGRRATESHWRDLHTDLEARVAERTAQLTAERERAEVLAGLGDALQRAASPEDVAALALDRLGPALRASSMLIVRLRGDAVEVLTFWGDLPEVILNFMTRPGLTLAETPVLQHVARTRSALYLGDYHGVPTAVATFPHLACAAEPILTPSRTLLGFAVAWRPPGAPWNGGQRDLMRRAASTLSLALERAQAAEELQAQTLALDAFAAYTELVGSETDVPTLAGKALELLCLRFPGSSGAYHEPAAALWRARAWTPNLSPEEVAQLRLGLPEGHPLIAAALGNGETTFLKHGSEGSREEAGVLGNHRTTAPNGGPVSVSGSAPLLLGGGPVGILTLQRHDTAEWSVRDRALFRAVGRGLNLALERAQVARQLAAQNAELAARTRALEGFAELSRDLTLERDPLRLIERAQDIILSLLPDGVSTYFEPGDALWQLRAWRGDFGSPDLLDALRSGQPRDRSETLDWPYAARTPLYRNRHAPGFGEKTGDPLDEIGAMAALPVVVEGEVRGVLTVGLHRARVWTMADRELLETAVRALSMALERAGAVQALEAERAALARRTEALLRSNRDLEQFAYVASHDLQEPLRTIASYTELLEKRYRGQLDARAETYITTIVDGAKRMKDLVQDLLSFSRVRSGEQRLSRVDLQDLTGDVVQTLEASLTALEGTVTFQNLPTVRGDRNQLAQLLQNLLGNALKFCRSGVPPRVAVMARRDNGGWHLSVRDNGIGIEERYFERIFRVFHRLHGQDEYGGTGMGLSICQQVVERHGGHIWVESVPGEGSTFHFTLPLQEGPGPGPQEQGPG